MLITCASLTQADPMTQSYLPDPITANLSEDPNPAIQVPPRRARSNILLLPNAGRYGSGKVFNESIA